MKKINYAIITAMLMAGISGTVQAQNWRDKNEGLAPTFMAKNIYGEGTSILVTNANLGFSNHLFHRPDTTTSFVATTTSFGGYGGVLSQIVKAKGTLFAGTTDGLYRSTDNGVTWSKSSSSVGYVYALYAINDTLYAGVGTGLGQAKMSTDTGQTWVSLGHPGFMTTHILKANGVLYVGTNTGLDYTPDNGTTWLTTAPGTGLFAPIITGLATLAGSVYAACSTGVYKTVDNGANWTVVLPKSMFSLTTVDTSLLGGTNNSGIYQSDQSGTNWNAINTGLPFVGVASYNAVNCIAYNNELLIASIQGDSAIYVTGLADLGLHPTTTTPPSFVNSTSDLQNSVMVYPNPATDAVTIELKKGDNTPIDIQIIDISGKSVYSTSSTKAQTQISLSDVKQGSYFVRVSQGDNKTTKMISIVR